MTLVEYSDSEPEEADDRNADKTARNALSAVSSLRTVKRKRPQDEVSEDDVPKAKLPALPPSFHSLYAANVRGSIKDDPSLHGGRQRQVPHVQGNWPSHVYIDWFPDQHQLLLLDAAIREADEKFEGAAQGDGMSGIHSFLRSDLGAQLPLHISLSAPLMLRTETKDDFVIKLKDTLEQAGILALKVQPCRLAWFSNLDASCHFLVLKMSQPSGNQLNKLLAHTNGICQVFGLPRLYDRSDAVGIASNSGAGNIMPGDRSGAGRDKTDAFHFSIAWTLETPSLRTREMVDKIDIELLKHESIHIRKICIKTGNIVTVCELESTT